MVLVIAAFIITAVFVGYHASQEYNGEIEVHSRSINLKTLNNSVELPEQVLYSTVS